MIKVVFPSQIVRRLCGVKEVFVQSTNLSDIVPEICTLYPDLKPYLLKNNAINPSVRYAVKEQFISPEQYTFPLSETEVITLHILASGG